MKYFITISFIMLSFCKLAQAGPNEAQLTVLASVKLPHSKYQPAFLAKAFLTGSQVKFSERDLNVCEKAVHGVIGSKAFIPPTMNNEQLAKLYKQKSSFDVFKQNFAKMPAEKAVSLAHAIDHRIQHLILCGSSVKKMGKSRDFRKEFAALAKCRLIDIRAGREIAFSRQRARAFHQRESAGATGALKLACTKAAKALHKKLLGG